jgi:hypothetical protein
VCPIRQLLVVTRQTTTWVDDAGFDLASRQTRVSAGVMSAWSIPQLIVNAEKLVAVLDLLFP